MDIVHHVQCMYHFLQMSLYLQGSRSGTPASSRGSSSSPRKSALPFKSAQSSVGRCGGGGEWDGGSVECVTMGREAVRLAEQQALANIGKLLFCKGVYSNLKD